MGDSSTALRAVRPEIRATCRESCPYQGVWWWLCCVMVASLVGCGTLVDRVGKRYHYEPGGMTDRLQPEARALLRQAFEDIDPGRFTDVHVHMVGQEVNRQWLTGLHPVKRFRAHVYLSAAGVTASETLAADYLARLTALAQSFPVPCRFFLYAMDRHYLPDGTVDMDRTPYHVANEVVYEAAQAHPNLFVPVISVHPYRKDAVSELLRWAGKGVRYVKWLPNAMGIDPLHPATAPFYQVMREHGLLLLCHTGEEGAVESKGLQEMGNPLRLRKALDAGVRVVALHCGRERKFEDLDYPEAGRREGFDLFLRLMSEPCYQGLLFGDISALTFRTEPARHLQAILTNPGLQTRLVNGSDYPISAIAVVIRLSRFVSAGMLSEGESTALGEIGQYNPLLFEFVLKRILHHPRTGERLRPSIFMLPTDWPDFAPNSEASSAGQL